MVLPLAHSISRRRDQDRRVHRVPAETGAREGDRKPTLVHPHDGEMVWVVGADAWPARSKDLPGDSWLHRMALRRRGRVRGRGVPTGYGYDRL
jgi:hypothetical protein